MAPRWLPDNLIRNLAIETNGNAWFATEKGIGLIERKTMTLAEKARFFEEEIDKYNRRTPYRLRLIGQFEESGRQERVDQPRQRQRRLVDGDVRRRRVLCLRGHKRSAGQNAGHECLRSAAILEPGHARRRTSRSSWLPRAHHLADQRQGPERRGALHTREGCRSRRRKILSGR